MVSEPSFILFLNYCLYKALNSEVNGYCIRIPSNRLIHHDFRSFILTLMNKYLGDSVVRSRQSLLYLAVHVLNYNSANAPRKGLIRASPY